MKTIREHAKVASKESKARSALRENLDRLAQNPPVVPSPGQAVSFEAALEITLSEDRELLERLAQ